MLPSFLLSDPLSVTNKVNAIVVDSAVPAATSAVSVILDIFRTMAGGILLALVLFVLYGVYVFTIGIPEAEKEFEAECKEIAPDLYAEYKDLVEQGADPDLVVEKLDAIQTRFLEVARSSLAATTSENAEDEDDEDRNTGPQVDSSILRDPSQLNDTSKRRNQN
jgi:hypothetical protein